MGNGSSKPGDARADQIRDQFAKNRARRQRARRALDSLPEDEWDEDTARLDIVMNNSGAPKATKAIVGILAAFPKEHRWVAFVVLVALILGLAALGGAKWLGLV